MRKKQGEQPIIRLGADKKAAPDPDFFQLNWKEVRNLLEENARLQVRSSELNQEYVELQERVASLGRLEISELAEDIRGGGEEKESKELHKARAEFEKVKKLSEACLLALDRNRADIHRQILKHREKWTEEINGKLEERLGAVESALSELKATQTDLYALAAVKD